MLVPPLFVFLDVLQISVSPGTGKMDACTDEGVSRDEVPLCELCIVGILVTRPPTHNNA
ncbi:MAG: hypothetical protein ABSD85_07615 [Acidimicrobiales bacterium]